MGSSQFTKPLRSPGRNAAKVQTATKAAVSKAVARRCRYLSDSFITEETARYAWAWRVARISLLYAAFRVALMTAAIPLSAILRACIASGLSWVPRLQWLL